jgi:alpha-glucosidase
MIHFSQKPFMQSMFVAGFTVLSLLGCRSTRDSASNLTGDFPGRSVDHRTFPALYGAKRQVLDVRRDGQIVDLKTTTLPIRIEVLRDDLIKVRIGNRETFGPEYSWSIAESFKATAVDYQLEEQGDRIILTTKRLTAVMDRNTAALTLNDKSGREVLRFDGLFADPFEDGSNQVPGKSPQKRMQLGAKFAMHPDDHFYGLGEKVRGQFDQSLDWRGKKRDLDPPGPIMGNRFEGADGGANGNVMIPFLLTTRGAGLFLDTVYRTYWEFDDPLQSSWYVKQDCDQDWDKSVAKCERAEMRFYMMVGDQPGDIINRYTDITGKPIMPPRWMLGYLQSNYGYKNWKEVEAVAGGLKADGFPLDGIFLDLQWFGGVPGVYSENGQVLPQYSDCKHRQVGSFQWGKNEQFDFLNPRPALARLKAAGVHVVNIEEGYIDSCLNADNPSNKNFLEGQSQGFLAKRNFASNEAALFANGDDKWDYEFGSVGYFGQVGMVDTSNEAARNWFWSKHLPILQDGVSGFWTDLGEPERYRWWWKYNDGLWHQDIHNVWDLNRARAFYEGYQKDLPNERPFLLSRSGYAGSQRFGVGIWSADAPARLGWAAAQPSSHMHLAISGVPYATSDVGGFGGFPVSNGKQFTRWLQMEAFSSMIRSHGNSTVGANTQRIVHPNGFGEPYTSINRHYLNWRESLIPYIYTHAREAFDTGMPIVRALPLVWPSDKNVHDLGSQFLLGPSILVAPVLSGSNNEPATRRDVYLPEGSWVDLHDGKFYKGGQWLRNFPTPLEKMPLFLRKGAIIPKAPISGSVSNPAWSATRIFEIFPSDGISEYELYDDDGKSNQYKEPDENSAKTKISIERQNRSVKIKVGSMTGKYSGMPSERSYGLEVRMEETPKNLTANGQTIPIEHTDETDAASLKPGTARWSARQMKLSVLLPAKDVRAEQTYSISF